jgi:D-alanyl-D-alanine carboxypeptidase (penicillin-binding protein 5/6)
MRAKINHSTNSCPYLEPYSLSAIHGYRSMKAPRRNWLFPLALLAVAALAAPPVSAQQHRPAQRPAAKPAPAQNSKPATGPAQPEVDSNGMPVIQTAAPFALLVDYDTGMVLLDKNADKRMFPSSMTKMLTAYIIFDKLKKGDIKLDDEFTVSERAWRTGGSKMFVPLGARVKLEDLLRGVIIQSGNDACVVLAEGLAGSEEAFAEEMNKWAKQLGLRDSNFRNSDGWPDPNHYSTAHDLAVLAMRTIRDFPEYYKYYAEREYTFNGIKQGNRNPLLYQNFGADGLKTGHTDGGGYGVTASAVREGRRLVLVLNGMASMKERAQESQRVMDWGFREWGAYSLYKEGDKVADADVWLGDQKAVPLVAPKTLTATLPRRLRKDMKVMVSYENPAPAPIHKGDPLGMLRVTAPNMKTMELPLVAGAEVGQLGVVGRMGAAVSYLVFGRGK